MRISIVAAQCSGHGRCWSVAPDLFECDDEGTGVVKRAELTPEDIASAKKAVASCPEGAIVLKE